MNQVEWEKAVGVTCPRCNQASLRFLNGLCPKCLHKKETEEARAMEYIAMALTYSARSKKKAISSTRRSLL